VKVNVLGAVVEPGSSGFPPDARSFGLHAAIYAARPDIRCIIHLHTPATAAVSAMRCGLLPVSRAALLLGDVAYYDFGGEVEDEADRVELQKSLGPTCKVLVLRNHGVLALGDTAEEAFYCAFHLQAACEVQVAAPARGVGEQEFEALMRMLDNLGYRTGYTYRYPLVQEKSKPKSDVLIPATVTAFVFEEDAAPGPALRQHAQRQQKEKTRWLNTPNTTTRVKVVAARQQDQDDGSYLHDSQWLKADEVDKGSSGTPIRIENPNQFVPLYTDPQEVLEMRNKIREQNRQEVKSAGPQSRLLASVIAETSRSPSTESHLGDAEAKETSGEEAPAEPEPPNPFSQLTDQELEDYKQEVERKKLELLQGDKKVAGDQAPEKEPPAERLDKGGTHPSAPPSAPPEAPKEKELVTSSPVSPEGSPSKSPSKKKKKFRTPSFLKKGKKKEKIES
ncbi:PREDICTED: beta-adducin-like, partial [Chaetura pelagica]|uniref:beta-adducin-like n=1 Tax=Chaetura pelagica TaxID=8897 RepID=UPI000523EA97